MLAGVIASARPREASLRPLAQLVRVLLRCPWVDGELRMELARDARHTTVLLYTERDGKRELVLPPTVFPVAFEEVDWRMAQTPDIFAPLRLVRHGGKLSFMAPGAPGVPSRFDVWGEDCPDEMPTVKRPPYILPEAFRSGVHRRSR